MAMSEKKRRKQMDLAQKALPGARVVGYAVGRGGTNPVLAGWIVLGAIFAIFLVLFALTGQVVIIGVLPAILVMQGVSPHRVIVSYDDCEFVRDLWRGFYIHEASWHYSGTVKTRRQGHELIITNYKTCRMRSIANGGDAAYVPAAA